MSRKKIAEKHRACRVCGCTEYDCSRCIERTGEACHWVAEDLCSACSTEEDPKDAAETCGKKMPLSKE